jgi:hypothetical protein
LKKIAISSILLLASKDPEKEPTSDLSPNKDYKNLTSTFLINNLSFIKVINKFSSTSMIIKKKLNIFYCFDDVQFLVLFFIIKHSLCHKTNTNKIEYNINKYMNVYYEY